MARRSLLPILALNVLVTFGVFMLLNSIVNRQRAEPTLRSLQPLVVVVTATIDPSQPPPVTVIVVTATAKGNAVAAANTPSTTVETLEGIPTLDPLLLPTPVPDEPTVEVTTSVTTDGDCPVYVVKAGDSPSVIANQYGVSTAELLKANDLTEADSTRIQIGQELVIPLEGCRGLPVPLMPTETLTPVVISTKPPTSTVAPTAAATAQLEVVEIIGAGDITQEGIVLRNISNSQIDMNGWTLEDRDGNKYTFPAFTMFSERRVILYTRTGNNGPLALFWGLAAPVWTVMSGDIVIKDANGVERGRYNLSKGAKNPDSSVNMIPTPTPT